MPELPEVGDGFFGCPPMFANVRFVLAGRLDRSPLSARDCCQSSALLSTLTALANSFKGSARQRERGFVTLGVSARSTSEKETGNVNETSRD